MSTLQKRSIRCAIYTRKSSEEGLEQSFNSLDAQREACQAYILSQRQEGWRAIDAAEVARGELSDRPRNKFTSIADMLDVAAAAPAPPLRRRLADRLRDLAELA